MAVEPTSDVSTRTTWPNGLLISINSNVSLTFYGKSFGDNICGWSLRVCRSQKQLSSRRTSKRLACFYEAKGTAACLCSNPLLQLRVKTYICLREGNSLSEALERKCPYRPWASRFTVTTIQYFQKSSSEHAGWADAALSERVQRFIVALEA